MEIEPKISTKNKSKWLIPAIIVAGIIVLGIISWAGYNYLLKSHIPEEQPKNEEPITEQPKKITGFCGYSTNGLCNTDNDCVSGGCSGQVCQSKSEEPIITTCEYTDCYNPQPYGLTCGCLNNKCQWK